MGGVLCLQGGAEFGAACEQVDRFLLRRSGGPVVLVPLAARSGREYELAGANGASWYHSLGATTVEIAPDARTGTAAAERSRAMLDTAGLVVLPGGSPARLLDALIGTGLGTALGSVLDRGGAVSGASAGAMVLCEVTFLPESGGRPALAQGLGLVPGVCVLPHYRAGDSRWLDRAELPAGLTALGIPECTGVIVEDGRLSWLGPHPAVYVRADGATEPLSPFGEGEPGTDGDERPGEDTAEHRQHPRP